jgi:predicted ester cyclase
LSAQENINKVESGLAAVNNHDVEGFVRLLEPGFKLYLIVKPENLMPQGQISGREGFAGYLNMLYTAIPDVHLRQDNIQASGNIVHQQLVILGKHSGPIELPNGRVLPPTGLKVQMPTEVFHTFNEQGGFISSTGYANLLDVVKQLGRFGP